MISQDNEDELSAHDGSENIEKSFETLLRLKRALDEHSIVSITDKAGTIIYANDMFSKVSKYTKRELLGQNHRILKSGYHSPEFFQDMWKTISSGKVWKNDIKNKAKDGTYYWARSVIMPVLDEKGRPQQYIAICTDITKQKEMEERLNELLKQRTTDLDETTIKLQHSEKKYRELYEKSPDLYRTINTDGIILDCNEAYHKKLGYSREEVIGASIFDHIPPESKPALRVSFETWKKMGMVHNQEMMMKTKDGGLFPVLVSASTLYDKNGKLIGSNTVIRDLSEIYQAKREANEERIKRLSAIGELASRLAHDLRNPLSIIKNTLELLKLESRDRWDEMTTKRFERIDRSVSRMNHQIENVLDFVRERPLNLKENSIAEILNSIMDMIENQPEIRINLPQNDLKVICDGKKLEIVLINLITNAIQAMNYRGEINIGITDEECYIVIEVGDSGPGIPDEVLPRIFDPLFTTRQIGTGLGLPSCKSIVEKHGGKIEVDTVVGKGTTFKIRLPKREKVLEKHHKNN